MWMILSLSYRVKSEREKQMSTTDGYMWNVESQLQRIYLQAALETDVEKRFADTGGEGEGCDELGDSD